MFNLTADETISLSQMAVEYTESEEERREVEQLLTWGFTRYGSDELIEHYGSREELLRQGVPRLLECDLRPGESAADVFARRFGTAVERRNLCRMVAAQGVAGDAVEDVVQEVLRRLWEWKFVTRYNPLDELHTWSGYVRQVVRSQVVRWFERRGRQPRTTSLSGSVPGNDSLDRLLYITGDRGDSFDSLVLSDFLREWEDFLATQEPFRVVVSAGWERLCVVQAPGTTDLVVEAGQELVVGLVSVGVSVCQVVRLDDPSFIHRRVPYELLQLFPEHDMAGQAVWVPYYVNPEYQVGTAMIWERTALEVYRRLRQGATDEGLVRAWGLPWNQSAQHWVRCWKRRLEQLFRDFWLITDFIPEHLKDLAIPTWVCTGCGRRTPRAPGVCRGCGVEVVGRPTVRLTTYPWLRTPRPQPRMTVSVPVCSVS